MAMIRVFLVLLSMLTGMLPLAVLAQDKPKDKAEAKPDPRPDSMGPLRGLLTVGPLSDGIWQGTVENGAYVLTNRFKPEAVQYFVGHPGAAQNGKGTHRNAATGRRAAVTVKVDGQPGAGAGLLFGFDPDSRTYCALVLQADQTLVLYRRGSAGFQKMLQAGGGAVRPSGNELRVQTEQGRVDAFVNGTGVATLAGSQLCAGSGVGIIAISSGTFQFSNFRLQ